MFDVSRSHFEAQHSFEVPSLLAHRIDLVVLGYVRVSCIIVLSPYSIYADVREFCVEKG